MRFCRFKALALTAAVWFAGCATQSELIEKRIAQRAEFFAALPTDKQRLLREGRLGAGDTRDAAWIVCGKPDRVFQKVSVAGTNEVWSYLSSEASFVDSPRPMYHPVRISRGRTVWRRDAIWATDIYHNPYEYLRIEFQDGRILTLESEQN